jgi:hypothetical protein
LQNLQKACSHSGKCSTKLYLTFNKRLKNFMKHLQRKKVFPKFVAD